MAHDVFICHSSEDKTIANAACAKLEGASIRCWIAPRDPIPGIPYGRQIVEAITAARVVLLIFSGHANRSEHVLRELEIASDTGKIIVPLRVEEITPSGDLRYYITRVHWLDAMTPPIEQRLDELTSLMRRLLDIPAVEPVAASDGLRRDVPPSPEKASQIVVKRMPYVRLIAIGLLVGVIAALGVTFAVRGGRSTSSRTVAGPAQPKTPEPGRASVRRAPASGPRAQKANSVPTPSRAVPPPTTPPPTARPAPVQSPNPVVTSAPASVPATTPHRPGPESTAAAPSAKGSSVQALGQELAESSTVSIQDAQGAFSAEMIVHGCEFSYTTSGELFASHNAPPGSATGNFGQVTGISTARLDDYPYLEYYTFGSHIRFFYRRATDIARIRGLFSALSQKCVG